MGSRLSLPSPKAPTVESKCLIILVHISHTLFSLSCNSHIQKNIIQLLQIFLAVSATAGFWSHLQRAAFTLGRSSITNQVCRYGAYVDQL
jgi:hypothetical protein